MNAAKAHGEALRAIQSLIGKSEKARQKLPPGTWQHTMLRDHLAALQVASALLTGESADSIRQEDLQAAAQGLGSLIAKTESALAKFSSGASQRTLLQNRLEALRVAQVLVKAEQETRKP